LERLATVCGIGRRGDELEALTVNAKAPIAIQTAARCLPDKPILEGAGDLPFRTLILALSFPYNSQRFNRASRWRKEAALAGSAAQQATEGVRLKFDADVRNASRHATRSAARRRRRTIHRRIPHEERG
jgi:hypothetical protein